MYKFKLKKDDLLNANFYIFSKSKKVMIVLYSNWVSSIMIVALFLYITINTINKIKVPILVLILYLILDILVIFAYEIVQKRWFKIFYKTIIDEKFGEFEEIEVCLDWDDFYLYWMDNTGERKIVYASIDKFVEVKENIFIILKNKDAFAVPKKIENIQEIINNLKDISSKKGINYIEELEWKF